MRLRDLFIDYCEIDGVRIVRVLNLDLYFAVGNSGGTVDVVTARFLSNEKIKALQDKTTSMEELGMYDHPWQPLNRIEGLYTEEDLKEIIEWSEKKRISAMLRIRTGLE